MLPLPEAPEQRRAQYAARYGEDNAAYLLQQDLQWTARYRSLGYIRSPELERPEYPKIAKRLAMERDWSFFAIDGDRRLLQKMVRGEWDDREFLVCPPGFRVSAAYDGFKITATPPGRRRYLHEFEQ